MTLSHETIGNYINELDPELRSYLVSDNIQDRLRDIATTYNLSDEEVVRLIDESYYVLMGLKPVSAFADELASGVKVNDGELAEIIESVDEQIIEPVSDLIPLHEDDKESFDDQQLDSTLTEESDERVVTVADDQMSSVPDSPRKAAHEALSSKVKKHSNVPAPDNLPGTSGEPISAPQTRLRSQGHSSSPAKKPSQSIWDKISFRKSAEQQDGVDRSLKKDVPRSPYANMPESQEQNEGPQDSQQLDGIDVKREVKQPSESEKGQRASTANYSIGGFDSFRETDHDHRNLNRDQVLAGIEDPDGETRPNDTVSEEELRQESPGTNDPDQRYGEEEDPYREPVA